MSAVAHPIDEQSLLINRIRRILLKLHTSGCDTDGFSEGDHCAAYVVSGNSRGDSGCKEIGISLSVAEPMRWLQLFFL